MWDTNTGDCDGDGVAPDFDGDYDIGVGGGFFGYGPWANEPTCQYGLKIHGGSVQVTDAISANIAFVTGADDQQGPIVIPTGFGLDPRGEYSPPVYPTEFACEVDGTISPCAPPSDGGACGPTDDPDDCLSDSQSGTPGYQPWITIGVTCGAGGDGGYWVFLLSVGAMIDESTTPPTVTLSGTPTLGVITA